MGLIANQNVQKCMAFESSCFRMWYKYEITYLDITGRVFTFVARSQEKDALLRVGAGWNCNYACVKLIKVEDLGADDQ